MGRTKRTKKSAAESRGAASRASSRASEKFGLKRKVTTVKCSLADVDRFEAHVAELAPPPADPNFRQLAVYRKANGLPAYRTASGGGTAAVAEVNGKKYYGISSQLGSKTTKAKGLVFHSEAISLETRRKIFEELKSKGEIDATNLGQAQFLNHAEAGALIKAAAAGPLPKDVTIYCDRSTCNNCKENLMVLAKHYGVERLHIHYSTKLGETLVELPKPTTG